MGESRSSAAQRALQSAIDDITEDSVKSQKLYDAIVEYVSVQIDDVEDRVRERGIYDPDY